MDHRHTGDTAGRVVDLSAFRRSLKAKKRRAATARKKSVTTSLHIDIYQDGQIDSRPLKVHRTQAISLLRLVLAVSNHLVEIHAGQAG